mgnify:CR=1 FL=1
MYLHEAMEDADGRFWPMVGLVPGKAVKKGRLVRFGYAVLTSENRHDSGTERAADAGA